MILSSFYILINYPYTYLLFQNMCTNQKLCFEVILHNLLNSCRKEAKSFQE